AVDTGDDTIAIVGVDVIVPPLHFGKDAILLVPKNRFDGVVPDQRVGSDVPVPDDVVGGLGHETEALVGGSGSALGATLAADIDHDRDCGDDVPFGILNRCRAHTNVTIGAVAATDSDLFAAHPFLGHHGARQRPLERRVL